MDELMPCSNPLAEYFTKLWLPTPVATMDIVISHQLKRRPPKKKSDVYYEMFPFPLLTSVPEKLKHHEEP